MLLWCIYNTTPQCMHHWGVATPRWMGHTLLIVESHLFGVCITWHHLATPKCVVHQGVFLVLCCFVHVCFVKVKILIFVWRSRRADAPRCTQFSIDICCVIQEGVITV